jgi:hypothetical protein
MKAPSATIRGFAEIRQKNEEIWDKVFLHFFFFFFFFFFSPSKKVMVAQKQANLELYVGSRLISSLSLARLSFFPRPVDGVLRLVFDGSDYLICPLDATVEEWEKKIREWAAYAQQIGINDLIVPPEKRAVIVPKLPARSSLKDVETIKEMRTSGKKEAEKERSSLKKEVDLPKDLRLSAKEPDSPALKSRKSVISEDMDSSTSFFGTIRRSPLLQALRRGNTPKFDEPSRASVVSPSTSSTSVVSPRSSHLSVAVQDNFAGDFGSAGSKMTNGKWKSCWYRLSDGKLLCFDSSASKLPISFLDVKTAVDVSVEEESRKKWVVVLKTSTISRKMGFDSRETAEEWVDMLKKESGLALAKPTFSNTTMELPELGEMGVDLHTAQMCFSMLQEFDGEDVGDGQLTVTSDLGSILEDILEMDE